MLVAVQLSVPGLYLPPVFKRGCHRPIRPRRSFRCRSTLPCDRLGAAGALVVLVAVQLSVLGLYLPPVLKYGAVIIRPRRSFRCRSRLLCERLGQRARWSCWWLSNYRCWDCICPPVFKWLSHCHLRPRRSFRCRSTLLCESSGSGRVGRAGGCPTIRAGIVSPASVNIR